MKAFFSSSRFCLLACHSERSEDVLLRSLSEKSRVHQVGVFEILRAAQDDMILGADFKKV